MTEHQYAYMIQEMAITNEHLRQMVELLTKIQANQPSPPISVTFVDGVWRG